MHVPKSQTLSSESSSKEAAMDISKQNKIAKKVKDATAFGQKSVHKTRGKA
jgi:hypothetical protein